MSRFLIFALCVSAVCCATVSKPVGDLTTKPEVEPIAIVNQESTASVDGTFHHTFEAGNGIKVEEEGTLKTVDDEKVVTRTGRVSYTDDEGNEIVLKYTADENGFHPEGDHLPTPPPVPEAILKGIEWARTHPYLDEDLKELEKLSKKLR